MKRLSLASLAVAAFAAFALASAPTAAAQEAVAAHCPQQEDEQHQLFDDDDFVAQNFTAVASGNLTRAEVSLARAVDTDEPFTVQIYAADTDGNPVGTALSTGTIDADNVPVGASGDDAAPVGVVFGTAAPIVAGQNYAIVISREEGDWGVGVRSNDECPGELRELVGDEWVEQNFDLVFRVFVALPGGPAPAALTCRGELVTVIGTDGSDEIVGTNGRDVVNALDGNDEVSGLDGNDVICGGGGGDLLRGQSGNDRIKGNRGADRVKGSHGDDRLSGNRGRDILKGKAGDDTLNGGRNHDVCRGGDGDNKIKNCES